MNALDLAMLVILFVALPLFGVHDLRKLRARIAAGLDVDRVRNYGFTIATQWTLTAVTLAIWVGTARPLAALGLTFGTGAWTWLGAGLGLLACAGLVAQMILILRSPEKTGELRGACEPMRPFLPTTSAMRAHSRRSP